MIRRRIQFRRICQRRLDSMRLRAVNPDRTINVTHGIDFINHISFPSPLQILSSFRPSVYIFQADILRMSSSSFVRLLPSVLLGTILQSMAYGNVFYTGTGRVAYATLTLLAGIFLVLCIRSIYVMATNRDGGDSWRQSPMRLTTFCITIFQLVLISGHWALNLSRLFDAFIYVDKCPSATIAYYATIAHPKYLTLTALYVLQGIVTDM